jgi:uncharacterized protein involved in type VI secretion and phage assembly
MTEKKNSLTLRLAGGGYEDLYPWNLVLEEGFSRLYRGELTVLSEKAHALQELRGLLDRGISVSMTQTLRIVESGVRRTRYLHGIVTEVRSAGVFSDGKKKDCYSYVLTIEPELARLKFTRQTAPYYRMNPLDIFETILTKYGIPARMKQNYISRAQYGRNLLFDQSETSDLDFLAGIAGLYGISFTFLHPKPRGDLGVADIYFSDGQQFPLSDIAYSDKREEPRIVSFDFLKAAEGQNIWKMDSWVMSNSIGFEGLKLNATYPNTNYGSEGWKWGKTETGSRYAGYNRLFHGYDSRAETGEVDDDIALILEARRLAAEQDKSRWTAAAPNLVLRPGLILSLGHFYGSKDREFITALVTGITLRHRARWPADLAAAKAEEAGGEFTEVRAACVNWGKEAEKRFCPPAATDKGGKI